MLNFRIKVYDNGVYEGIYIAMYIIMMVIEEQLFIIYIVKLPTGKQPAQVLLPLFPWTRRNDTT